MIYKSKKELIRARKSNARLYPIYKMFSWDLLFYYSIVFLFLTQTKGFSMAQIMFLNALQPLFKILLQVPCTIITEKLGNRNGMISGNILVTIYLVVLIMSNNIFTVALAYFISSLGFTLKDLTTTNLLYDSVTSRKCKGFFSILEKKGASYYYYFDGTTSLLTGFLFVVNGYLPIIVTIVFTIVAIIISFLFKEIKPNNNNKSSKGIFKEVKSNIKDLKISLKFIIKSKRLKALLIFGVVFCSFFYIINTCRQGLLTEINISPEYFGVIFSCLTFLAGIGTSYIDKLQKLLKNRILSYLSMIFTITCIIMSGSVILKLPTFLTIIIILICFAIQYMIECPYYTLSNIYLKSFASSKMRVRIRATYRLVTCLGQSIVAFISSYILSTMTSSETIAYISLVYLVLLIVVLMYMRKRIGLKPEEYSKDDIETLKENN